ncbi:Crp/Fnr family transcriptional regulator [Afipia sp. P52-10]|uniref:Crp/Fnr family transcriptional regulator n=1 Tax=Afipia sp. P52-10 TaxID=1429916 RepID=UPI0013640365|nr:Crp/Fnr family transcriptional regulator [Afipia sp. P52-10]
MILATLPEVEFEQLRPFLTPVELKRNSVIYDANKPVDAVYFVESGVISRVARTQQDGPVEVAMVGHFGFVGVSVVLGTNCALQRTIVQIPGTALRIEASDLQRIMQETPSIKDHLLRYVQLLMTLKAQVSFCNAKHEIDKRVARWLLAAQDRIGEDELPVTHSLVASMLGVRRPGVSEALAQLEGRGVLERQRGSLRIVSTAALREHACECHKIIDDRFSMLRELPRFEHHLQRR